MTPETAGLGEEAAAGEEALVRKAVQGDAAALGRLFEMHRAALYGMVLRQLGQREEAEDVVQHVFMKALQNIGNFRGEAKFFTWLYSIALNHVKNCLRAKSLRRTVSIHEPLDAEDRGAPQWPDRHLGPEQKVQQKFELQAVRSALTRLNPDLRTIFIMHYFNDLGLEEVARRMGKPLGTVKVYLLRARKALYKALQEQNDAFKPPAPQGPGTRSQDPV